MIFIILNLLIAGDTHLASIVVDEIQKVRQVLRMDTYREPVIYITRDVNEFYEITGLSPVRGGAYINDTIYLIPLEKILASNSLYIIRHEYVHHIFSEYNFPVWVDEGLAVMIGGPELKRYPYFKKEEIEAYIQSLSQDTLHMAYASALFYVTKEIERIGFENFIRIYRRER